MLLYFLTTNSHREWRKTAKKERRRRIRKQKAKNQLDIEDKERLLRLTSPTYLKWLEESEKMETLRILEEDRIRGEANQKWIETEIIAQKQWRELRMKIAKAKQERAENDFKIKEEWEREQKRLKEAEEKILRAKIDKERIQQDFELKITEYLNRKRDIPSELLTHTDTKPDTEHCPFYSKTGVCRFGDDCSRNHRKPTTGKILLAQNFYTNFGLEHSKPNEYDTDVFLESEDADTYQDFKNFFFDVLPEFERFGEVVQFKVCCNRERHLRGNTYIEYFSTRSAIKAHRALHTRWYGGRQLSLQFCLISSWKSAICGLAYGNRCPKGLSCNFLHVFRNPGNRFDYTRTPSLRNLQSSLPRSARSSPRRTESYRSNWRWSESPEIEIKYRRAKSKDRKNQHHNGKQKASSNSRSKKPSR